MAKNCNFTREVLRRLKLGQHISSLTAAHWVSHPSTKLTSRIGTLRSEGYTILDEWQKSPNGYKYKVYYMKKGSKK